MLTLNELDYLEMPGLNVMLALDFYPEGHQGGVGIIQNGARVAANGDLRLDRTPGQWQPVPAVGERRIDRATGEISVRMSYPDPAKDRTGFNPIEYPNIQFSYELKVRPDGDACRVTVDLDAPLPAEWIGRVGFNLELFPATLFGKSWNMDGRCGIFPLSPNGPGRFDAQGEYCLDPLACGRELAVAPEADAQRLSIRALRGGPLELIDGRARHSNGWFVVRSLVETGAATGAVEWLVAPHALPGFRAEPVVQVSQVGYRPDQPKFAVVELDRADTERPPLVLERLLPGGGFEAVLESREPDWGRFLRFDYRRLDFSAVREPGMYRVRHGEAASALFRIGDDVFSRQVWQPTLETFLPVQMCHMKVVDGYRVWHAACHLDDARMAPVNHNHFDGYIQGPSTLCDFKPGEHVPGLDRGGWHDAGDFDLRVESQAGTVFGLALAWEEFRLAYDNTTVDQASRTVTLRRPDGRPDLLKQIEHGLLSLLGGHRALGRFYRGIIEPTLEQYVLLGDPSVQTDNLVCVDDPARPADDRWVFTEDNPGRPLGVAACVAAAGRAMRGFDETLAAECLETARKHWRPDASIPLHDRVHLAVELLLSTGAAEYAEFLVENALAIAGADLFARIGWLVGRAMPLLSGQPDAAAAVETLDAAAERHAAMLAKQATETPYGVPYKPHIWGAGWNIQAFGLRQYFLHRAWPTRFGTEGVFRALDFILGCHPGANTASFVSAVGARSVTQAYGQNRGDRSFIPGGSVSGTALIRPDFPELLEWPFLWQQTEYVLGGGTTDYLFLALAADHLGRR
jgi:hypothetical protein